MRSKLVYLAGMMMVLVVMLSACQAEVVEVVKEVIVEKEVVKEVEVEKIVIEEKAVEVERIVEVVADTKSGGDLVVVTKKAGTGSLDPLWAKHTQVGLYQRHLSDPLAHIDPLTGAPAPALATSWEESADGTSITFHLREDVTFHDGTPFNAEAVKFNIDRIQEAGAESRRWTGMGGDTFVGTEVVDEFTVTLSWTAAQGEWWFDQAYWLYMQSPTAIQEAGDDYGVTTVVGTGPFKLVDWVEGESIQMVKNPDYNWGSPIFKHSGPAYLDTLTFKGIPETGTRLAALETGEVHVIDGRSLEYLMTDMDSRRGFKVDPVPKAGTSRTIHLNSTRAPFDDIRVRQAFSHAIDRDLLLLTPRYSGVGKVAYATFAAYNWPGGDTSEFKDYNYLYDLEKANSLLDDAGWVDSDGDGTRDKDGVALSAEFVIPASFLGEMEPIQAMQAEVGLDMVLTTVDVQTWFNAMEERLLDGSIRSNSGMGFFMAFFHSEYKDRPSGISDPALDALLDELVITTDINERKVVASEAEKIILQTAMLVPIIDQMYPWMMQANVQDVFMPLDSWARYYDTWIEQ